MYVREISKQVGSQPKLEVANLSRTSLNASPLFAGSQQKIGQRDFARELSHHEQTEATGMISE
jgi:hypothetical protein